MSSFLNNSNLDRVRQMLDNHDIAAVISSDPDNFFYTSGYLPPGRSGSSMTVTPSSGEQAMIVSRFEESAARGASDIQQVFTYLNWVEVHDVTDLREGTAEAVEKPVQFSKEAIFQLLADVLRDLGLEDQRLGIELSSLSHEDVATLQAVLPRVEWVNSKPIMYQARAVKAPHEIELLRIATELAEIGHDAAVASPRGKTIQQLRVEYRKAVYEAALKREDAHGVLDIRSYISAGPRVGPNLLVDAHKVQDGDVVFIDSGVTVNGYASDMGRCYAVGQVDDMATRFHKALLEGYLVGLDMIKPGVPMADMFEAINSTIQKSLPSYVRGHFGHVPGIGFGEQPPFIAPREDALLEEGMVLNIETPYYIKGLGGLQVEDMLLVTTNGYECFNSSAREMITV